MTTNVASVSLVNVKILKSQGQIKISAGTQVCVLDCVKVDAVWDTLTPAEMNVMTPIVNVDAGKLTDDELSGSDLRLIMSVRAKSQAYSAPIVKADHIPDPTIINPAGPSVQPVVNPPCPIIQESVKPAANLSPVLTSMENHTATVSAPADYAGGTKKKRVRKTDSTILELYEDVAGYCRAVGLDDMERRISQLERARDFANAKVKRMTYDIPTAIRLDPGMIEPTKVLRCCGPMPTESECLMREETVESAMFGRFRSILDSYKKGTPNADRLGCFLTYRISGVAYEDLNDLRETVSEALDAYLVKAHTSMILAIGKADDALKAAMGSENKTLNDMEKAQCTRDNHYRANIMKAHEALNIALRAADRFDLTMETVDLIKANRAALASIRESFNAETAKRDAKGIDI